MKPPPRAARWLYGAACGVYLIDRLTKLWVEGALRGRPPIRVIPGVLQLSYTTNSGGAFGVGGSAPLLFAAATIGVSIAIVIASFRIAKSLVSVAFGLILGGALGNLTDRILHGPGLSGRVTDFIDFRIWPVFNVADSAIVIGVALLLLATVRREDRPR